MALSFIQFNQPTMESFTGPYAMTSHKYSEALWSAPFLWANCATIFGLPQQPHTATFSHRQPGYCTNRPLWTAELWSRLCLLCNSARPHSYKVTMKNKRCTQVVVEVHIIPGHIMDWHLAGAEFWAEPPRHICYVQPHTFLATILLCSRIQPHGHHNYQNDLQH
jgi:hypothetical protein